MVGFGLRLLEIHGLKVCLWVFWTTPVRPVSLGLNCPTGQTGPVHRSDRSVCAALRFEKFLSSLLPRCDLGLLLRDSLSIAILADLGSRACGDFGT